MVLFDFDGVLANSLETCLAACDTAARQQGCVAEFGSDTFADLDPLTFEALAERLGLEPIAFATDVSTAVKANPVPSQPFAGVPQMIAALGASHKLAVVSASHSDVLSAFLKSNRLDASFQHVLGGDKPGDKATKIKALLGDTISESDLFVGDAVSDVAAAHAVGIACCAVAWGWQPLERLIAHNPDYVAHDPFDIIAIANARLSSAKRSKA
ncbi:MAG: HAD hydrolase-like protein [Pseudomonadota bacterium]